MKLILILAGTYVNKRNCRIWGTENPHSYIEKPTHSKRLTVWPFFFENEQEEAVVAIGDPCWVMLNEFLFTQIEEEDSGNVCFQ